MRKTVLALAPVVPDQSEINFLATTLAFLEPYCQIDWLDPLSVVDNNLKNEAYYFAWRQQIVSYLKSYEAFIGFSFGGVVLQQCFPLFEGQGCPIILFSTPTVVNCALYQKLSTVIELLNQHQIEQALSLLYKDVFYPHHQPPNNWASLDHEIAAKRLISGLTRVLTTDSTHLVKTAMVHHLHLIGECSTLVNSQNVLPSKAGLLLTVPGAGMRVLQDNLPFCRKEVIARLHCES